MNTETLLTTCDRDATCVLLGHTDEDFIRFCGDSQDTLLAYQRLLYQMVDERLSAGMRIFTAPLLPGVPLWLAEYVMMRRDAEPEKSIQLHIMRPKQIKSPLSPDQERVLSLASKMLVAPSNDYFDMYNALLHQAGNLLIIEQCPGTSIEVVLANKLGLAVTAYSLADLRGKLEASL